MLTRQKGHKDRNLIISQKKIKSHAKNHKKQLPIPPAASSTCLVTERKAGQQGTYCWRRNWLYFNLIFMFHLLFKAQSPNIGHCPAGDCATRNYLIWKTLARKAWQYTSSQISVKAFTVCNQPTNQPGRQLPNVSASNAVHSSSSSSRYPACKFSLKESLINSFPLWSFFKWLKIISPLLQCYPTE